MPLQKLVTSTTFVCVLTFCQNLSSGTVSIKVEEKNPLQSTILFGNETKSSNKSDDFDEIDGYSEPLISDLRDQKEPKSSNDDSDSYDG